MLKQIVKKRPVLMNILAFIYSLLNGNSNFFWKKNKCLQKGAFLKHNKFEVAGHNNMIEFGARARIENCKFTIIGNNCKIIVGGGNTIVSNVHFWCQDNESRIIIGNDFTMQSGHIAATEGKSIIIGEDCMFSGDIEIRNGDSHSIIDKKTKRRVNHAKDVVIGKRVWLTAHVRVLKGSVIPSHSIIGNSSVVSGKLEDEYGLYSGIPCKKIKDNIDWDREKL